MMLHARYWYRVISTSRQKPALHQVSTMVLRPTSSFRTRTTGASIRPPIILHITDRALIAGRAGGIPKHTEPLLPSSHLKDATATPDALYRYYVDPIRTLLYRVTTTTTEGTYVLIVSHHMYPRRAWKTTLAQCILDEFGTAVAFCSTLHAIPVSLAMVSSTLWVVEIQKNNSLQCLVTADDHALEFTYQSASRPTEGSRALALSLLACPLSHRKAAISNIVVVGPGDRRAVVQSFYQYLLSPKEDPTSNDDTSTDHCYYAVDTPSLRALAPHISMMECDVDGTALAWAGASIWASRKAHDASCWETNVPEY